MHELLYFISKHKYFAVMMFFLNCISVKYFIDRMVICANKWTMDAMGGRNEKQSLYGRCITMVKRSIHEYEGREKKSGVYEKARDKMRKSGYRSEHAAVVYLLVKYLIPVILFIVSFIANFPRIPEPFITAVSVMLIVEAVTGAGKKKHTLRFQKNIYKIYKYLHCQVSSGVRVTDAVKTVYEVIEDKGLKEILVQLAARYELTQDIDASLDEFKSNFDAQEAETLCVALKQGIVTGDNRELLARQEEMMFSKYFNYIQAETDSCRTRSVIAAAIYTAIIVAMIAVPLFNDVTDAAGRIFMN